MIPLHLSLKNFLAYRDPAPLDFSGIHVAALVGENGAGKSSLLDAITWALWGRARARTDAELLHQGQAEMRVEFTFLLGAERYRVIRAKKVGKGASTTLDFQVGAPDGGWTSLSEGTIPKTQDKIVERLRLKYETFINSAYLMQGKADEFTSRTAAQRKEVLADILGLEEWADREQAAAEKVRGLDQQIAGQDAVLQEVEAELGRRAEYERDLAEAEASLGTMAERLRQAEAGWAEIDQARQAMILLQKRVDDSSRRIQDIRRALKETDAEMDAARQRSDAAALQAALHQTQQRLASLAESEAEREQLTAERQAAGEEIGQLRGQNEAVRQEGETLNKRLDALQAAAEPRCPTCGQPLAEEVRIQLVRDLTADRDARRASYRANTERLKALTDDQTRLDRRISVITADLKGRAALASKAAEFQTALAQATEAAARLPGLEERRAGWMRSLQEGEAQRRELDREADGYESILRDSAVRQQALGRLRKEETLARSRQVAARQRLDTLQDQEKRRESIRARLKALAGERALHKQLREAFGKNGIPAMLIEAAVPEIESGANTLLHQMTAGRMHVRLNTQRQTQGGDTRETLEIQIADELGTRAYEMYSGGEAFRVNFAIRLALSQLLARRAGTQLQTLIVDEGFGVLDAAGRERLVDAIKAAEAHFHCILVITHIEELRDAFPSRIEITKGPEGSQISVA
jgi:DNA repair protein SbcC/Rad50